MTEAQAKKRTPETEVPTAIPRTESARVSHPTLEGHTENVTRVIDTLAAMFKRKQIGEREYQAAEKYRTAHATLYGTMGGVMDFERTRGGSMPGQAPAMVYMLAAEISNHVKTKLYPKDYAVMHRVVALGFSIKDTAEQLYGKPSTRAQEEDCGRRLREALEQMADWEGWFPKHEGRGSAMRSHISERPTVTDVESVPQARTVHATGNKIFEGRVK